jgi:predicted house-cleaning noncanonical NTP pyrophosphatase (MazG superfamily)
MNEINQKNQRDQRDEIVKNQGQTPISHFSALNFELY